MNLYYDYILFYFTIIYRWAGIGSSWQIKALREIGAYQQKKIAVLNITPKNTKELLKILHSLALAWWIHSQELIHLQFWEFKTKKKKNLKDNSRISNLLPKKVVLFHLLITKSRKIIQRKNLVICLLESNQQHNRSKIMQLKSLKP